MDTLIGQFTLTENQVANFVTIDPSPFKGFKYQDGQIVAVSNTQPLQQDIDDLKNKIDGLSDNLSQVVLENKFDINEFLIDLENAMGESVVDDLASHVRRFERYGQRKDFGKIKRLGERLVQKGDMTQKQFNGMSALFLSKGIDLGNY